MTEVTDLGRYMDLFVHRSDVYAVQQSSGAYFPELRPITEAEVEEHLAGFASYGTYVIDPADNTCRYLVWDLDIQDPAALDFLQTHVEDMVTGALAAGDDFDTIGGEFNNLMCEFSGNKGYHVWLFLSEPVPAEKLRRWVSAKFTPKWVEAAQENGWPTAIEVFPKQDGVMEGGFGNLVKLPFGVHAVSGGKSEAVLTDDHWWATDVSEVVPFPVHLVPDCEPVTPLRVSHRSGGTGDVGPHAPFACIDHIRNEGVGSGHRDRSMFHLALYYYGHGVDQDMALEMCLRANESFDPPMSEGEVASKVASAYRGTYESAACGQDWLADICPGPCKAGWHVARSVSQSEVGVLLRTQAGESIEVDVVSVNEDRTRRRVTIGHADALNQPTLVVGKG